MEGYSYYIRDVHEHFGDASPARSYWVLITRHILEESRSKLYSVQKASVGKYSRHGYGLPLGLEVALGILLHYARHKERLFGDKPWTYTRCSEDQLVSGQYPISVGGFWPMGLCVYYDYDGYNRDGYVRVNIGSRGVACRRKF